MRLNLIDCDHPFSSLFLSLTTASFSTIPTAGICRVCTVWGRKQGPWQSKSVRAFVTVIRLLSLDIQSNLINLFQSFLPDGPPFGWFSERCWLAAPYLLNLANIFSEGVAQPHPSAQTACPYPNGANIFGQSQRWNDEHPKEQASYCTSSRFVLVGEGVWYIHINHVRPYQHCESDWFHHAGNPWVAP